MAWSILANSGSDWISPPIPDFTKLARRGWQEAERKIRKAGTLGISNHVLAYVLAPCVVHHVPLVPDRFSLDWSLPRSSLAARQKQFPHLLAFCALETELKSKCCFHSAHETSLPQVFFCGCRTTSWSCRRGMSHMMNWTSWNWRINNSRN